MTDPLPPLVTAIKKNTSRKIKCGKKSYQCVLLIMFLKLDYIVFFFRHTDNQNILSVFFPLSMCYVLLASIMC